MSSGVVSVWRWRRAFFSGGPLAEAPPTKAASTSRRRLQNQKSARWRPSTNNKTHQKELSIPLLHRQSHKPCSSSSVCSLLIGKAPFPPTPQPTERERQSRRRESHQRLSRRTQNHTRRPRCRRAGTACCCSSGGSSWWPACGYSRVRSSRADGVFPLRLVPPSPPSDACLALPERHRHITHQ